MHADGWNNCYVGFPETPDPELGVVCGTAKQRNRVEWRSLPIRSTNAASPGESIWPWCEPMTSVVTQRESWRYALPRVYKIVIEYH